MFLGKYKMMLGADCKLIYGSKDYHRKRLKVLENEKYVKRVNRLYIKLADKGTKIVKEFGYDYSFACRKKMYIERVNEIARIAALGINSTMEFVASWNLKDRNIYTETSRRYIGELIYLGRRRVVYYISKDKATVYISQIINDIHKIIRDKNVIIFMEKLDYLKSNKNFVFGNESTMIINPTQQNLDNMRKLEKIDVYQVIKTIYGNVEILLSNWKKADYMTEDRKYIVVMPFLDTERLHSLNIFYRNNQNSNRKIDRK